MDAGDWIAVYAAGLSTVIAGVQWRGARRHLKMSSCHAYNSAEHPPAGTFTRVTIANHGSQTVFVRTIYMEVHVRARRFHETLVHLYRYWRWQRGSWVGQALPATTINEPALPSEILPGRSLTVWLRADDLMTISKGRRIRLVVQDEMDRSMRSPDLALHHQI
ncbi:hypothetical protein J2W22_002864 [Sphingomonas kyeonggiensis]|uniref:hypothetical protein n=1 Tax=Sphingomonas kyeonggiensis TaxID=1268553 RepID=UPI002787CE8F|nr:hypothetical protein [Sphingomonas kyeonggiensis]MDQ0250800.1 hypothetical protein [Sphingomonas kyeonggiensis]